MRVVQIFLAVCAYATRDLCAGGPANAEEEQKYDPVVAVFDSDDMANLIFDMCRPLDNMYPLTSPYHVALDKRYPLNPAFDETIANMKQCSDKRRLSLIVNCFSQLPLPLAYSVYSPILPTARTTIRYVIDTICTNLNSDNYPEQAYYDNFANHLIAFKEFEALIYLFQNAPFNRFFSFCESTMRALSNSEERHESFKNFLQKHETESPLWYFSLIQPSLMPALLNEVDLDALIQACSYNVRLVMITLYAIGKSCTTQYESYTAEYCAILHDKNTELIQKLDNVMQDESQVRLWSAYARLLNEIRFNPQFMVIDDSVVSSMIKNYRPSPLVDMLSAAVYSNKPDVFRAVWALSGLKSLNDENKEAIIQHPEFARLYLGPDYLKSESDISIMLSAVRWERSQGIYRTVADIGQNLSIDRQLVLIAEIDGLEVFKLAIQVMAGQLIFNRGALYATFFCIMYEFDNPVPFVNFIFSFGNIKTYTLRDTKLTKGVDRYLRALFSDAGIIEESCRALGNLQILLTPDFLESLLGDATMIANVSSEQALPIRKLFNITFNTLMSVRGNGLRLLRLLSILKISISDWSFSAEVKRAHKPMLFSSSDEHWCWLYAKITTAASESGFLSHLVLSMCSKNDMMRFNKSVEAGEFNPLALPCWELFALWYHTNSENFCKHVPKDVYEAFTRYSPESGAADWVEYAKRYVEEGGTSIC